MIEEFDELNPILTKMDEDSLLSNAIGQEESPSCRKASRRSKVTYKKKIKEIGDQETDQQLHYSQSKQQWVLSSKQKKMKSKEERLKRNRQAAKMSRKRKNRYMEMLQSKVVELQKQVEKYKKALEEKHFQRQCSIWDKVESFVISRRKLFLKLERSLKEENEEFVGMLLENMKVTKDKQLRLGAAGEERLATMNYLFENAIHLIIPDIYKFLLVSAVNDCSWQKIIQQTKIPQQYKPKINSFKEKLKEHKQRFDKYLAEIIQKKKIMEEEVHSIQGTVLEISCFLSSKEMGRLLIKIEQLGMKYKETES